MKLHHLFLLAFLFLFSCKKEVVPDIPVTPVEKPKGKVKGKVVAPNNKTAIRNALVFIQDSGLVFHTYTNVNGEFELEAPAGARELHIQSGTGKIFRTKLNVTVEANQTNDVSSGSLTLIQAASLAYVPGTYDKIQAILMDSLGYTAQMIDYNTLHQMNLISPFTAIFINCSSNITTDWLQDSVLASYVANGGSLYVSDWAVANLIGTNGGNCPAPRMGGFIPDDKLCTQRNGVAMTMYNSPIVSASLQTYLNKSQMDVKYDLGTWEMVMNYAPTFWELLVTNPNSQAPMLMRTSKFTNSTAGSINIGSNNNMVTICHKPQGSVPVTITIPSADLAFHLAHGDTKGSCSSVNGAGRIYYTAFHTQPNGLISPDMKHILDYIILNL
jgi:hypothetical protein